MKKIILFILLMGSKSALAGAAMVFFTHTLQLTDDQIPVVTEIMKQEHAEHKKLRKYGRPSCDEMSELRSYTRQRLDDVLNDQQLVKYDGMLERRRKSCEVRASYGGDGIARNQ